MIALLIKRLIVAGDRIKTTCIFTVFSLSFTLCDMQALLRVRNSLTEMTYIF